MKQLRTGNRWVVLGLIGMAALAGCDDDPTNVEEHPEPEGVQLVLNGQTIASYDGGTQTWTGEMDVDVGTETAHISVQFLDGNGNVLQPESDTYLEVEVADESIAEFEQDTPGEFGGHLHGNAVGETDVVFRLMHGAVGSGHADFVTTAVHAHVN